MSIINDALKKTQAELERRQWRHPKPTPGSLTILPEPVASALPDTVPLAPQKKTALYTAGLVCLFVVIAGFLFAVVDLSWNRFSSITQNTPFPFPSYQALTLAPAPVEQIPSASLSTARPANPAVVNKTQPAQEGLLLTGTMMIGKKRVALINGDGYEIGDSIDNKKIVNITLEKVELLSDGKITTLHVRRKP